MSFRFALKPLSERASLSLGLKSKFALKPLAADVELPLIAEPEAEIEFDTIFVGGQVWGAPSPWILDAYTKDGGDLFAQTGGEWQSVSGVVGYENYFYWTMGNLRKSPGREWPLYIWDIELPSTSLPVREITAAAGIILAGSIPEPHGWGWYWTVQKRSLVDGSLVWQYQKEPYNNYSAVSSADSDASGIYLAGHYGGAYTSEDYIEKLGHDGNVLWSKAIGTLAQGVPPRSMKINTASMILVRLDYSQAKIYIERRDLAGNLLWTVYPDEPFFNSESVDTLHVTEEHFYIGGFCYPTYPEDEWTAYWTVQKRRISDGGLVWSRMVSPGDGNGYRVTGLVADSKAVYSCGYRLWGSSVNNPRIEKRDLDGNLLWERYGPQEGIYRAIGGKQRTA